LGKEAISAGLSVFHIEMKSKQAGLRTMLEFEYDLQEAKKIVKTLSTEKMVERY